MTKDIEAVLDQAQKMGFRTDHTDADFAPFLGFSTRDTYLEWRTVWRALINELSNTARQARVLRVRAIYLSRQGRVCTDPEETAKLLVDENTAWQDIQSLGDGNRRSSYARSLLALRAASKREAGRQWQAARLSVAA